MDILLTPQELLLLITMTLLVATLMTKACGGLV